MNLPPVIIENDSITTVFCRYVPKAASFVEFVSVEDEH
jgi:hypothetical protein